MEPQPCWSWRWRRAGRLGMGRPWAWPGEEGQTGGEPCADLTAHAHMCWHQQHLEGLWHRAGFQGTFFQKTKESTETRFQQAQQTPLPCSQPQKQEEDTFPLTGPPGGRGDEPATRTSWRPRTTSRCRACSPPSQATIPSAAMFPEGSRARQCAASSRARCAPKAATIEKRQRGSGGRDIEL